MCDCFAIAQLNFNFPTVTHIHVCTKNHHKANVTWRNFYWEQYEAVDKELLKEQKNNPFVCVCVCMFMFVSASLSVCISIF